jgi:hypothetical protein
MSGDLVLLRIGHDVIRIGVIPESDEVVSLVVWKFVFSVSMPEKFLL